MKEKLKLIVRTDEGERTIEFSPGNTIRDILDQTDIRVRSGCRNKGACGLCKIRVIAGDVGAPTENENVFIDPEEIADGVRLACQIIPSDRLTIEVVQRAVRSEFTSIPEQQLYRPPLIPTSPDIYSAGVKKPLAAAIDLGTTNINLSLISPTEGLVIATRRMPNPQAKYGADVISRLTSASVLDNKASDLSGMVIDAIGRALTDIFSREGVTPTDMVAGVIVANSAMLAILLEGDCRTLLDPVNWKKSLPLPSYDKNEIGKTWMINPDARIEAIPPLIGFVGSDLLAGLIAVDFFDSEAGSLFIDLGTNTELAYNDGERILYTSAAGGPAFEGCGFSRGAPADVGAIYRVFPNEAPEGLDFSTIGGAEPIGFCGSAMVDAIAILRRQGKISDRGKIVEMPPGEQQLRLFDRAPRMTITNNDIDVFQRAKAAIGSGCRALINASAHPQVNRIFITGSFGHFLDVPNMFEIGMIPDVGIEKVTLLGNTALAGAERLCLYPEPATHASAFLDRISYIDLTDLEGYDDLFFENLYLNKSKLLTKDIDDGRK